MLLDMKTYFIAGRSKEFESVSNQFITVSDSESSREPTEAVQGNQQISFRKVKYHVFQRFLILS